MQENTLSKKIEDVFRLHQQQIQNRREESVDNRKTRLKKLQRWIHANRTTIQKAMFADFSKPATEVDVIEIFHVLNEIKYALSHLDRWTKPKEVDAPLTMLGTQSFILHEPKGICLIIAPWNYPFCLAAGPLVSALAAGNSIILKPSELTPHVSALLKKMAEEIFDENIVSVFEGGPEIAQALLKLPFHHIFFTGSPTIGKAVMRAAADNLASVTLELGGKSPAIVSASADIHEAAQRIAIAKFINNGQTCLAPDYVLVEEKIQKRFITALIAQTQKHFVQKHESFETSASYCRIVNDHHFARLNALVNDALQQGAQQEFGGPLNQSTRFIHPMILSNVPHHTRIMEEEIFGPILPVITYKKLEDALNVVNLKPKPLALYIFSTRRLEQKAILRQTSSGGVCINDCAIHFLNHRLPFGGVNHSGIGKSHGYYGFLSFSNEKPVLRQKHGFTTVQPFYPPYTTRSQKLIHWFLKMF